MKLKVFMTLMTSTSVGSTHIIGPKQEASVNLTGHDKQTQQKLAVFLPGPVAPALSLQRIPPPSSP